MAENKDEEFSDKFSDKKLRATAAKLECESENDTNALKIVLGKSMMTNNQRNWVQSLIGRRGKKFVFLGGKQSSKPDRESTASSDAPLNSKKLTDKP